MKKKIDGGVQDGKHIGNKIQREANAGKTCLTPEHREILLRSIEKDPILVRIIRNNPGDIFLAGGFPVCALIGEQAGDVDIFGRNPLLVLRAAHIYGRFSQSHKMEATKYTLSTHGRIGKVQFVVKSFYPNARECIDAFDFGICQAAIWFQDGEWQTACSPLFYPDLKARRLRFVNQDRINEAPSATLWRAAKYTQRGFKMTQADRLALMESFFLNCQRKNAEQTGDADIIANKRADKWYSEDTRAADENSWY